MDDPAYSALDHAVLDAALAEPRHLRPEEELWLEALIADVGEARRLWAIADDDFWQRIDTLWQRGHERLAIEWLEKFIAAPATPRDKLPLLRARLIELYDQRGDLGGAVAHLEALRDSEEHAVRASYLLAEHYRRTGDEARALRYYEAVLARDMDYPNVRVRVERLRQRRGRAAPLSMGETIAGAEAMGMTSGARYHLVRELGRGATGVVYLARDTELERDVAVKLLHPHLATADRARACAQFFDEARICASLRHPNILAVLDMDERARRIIMELAAGGTLRQVLSDRGPRPLRRALERHAQILSALEAAHRRGVVHRDLKPGNLMFRRDPDEPGAEIVLGDFGVAHLPDARGATGAEAVTARKPAEAVGTLAYMAPEQRRGDSIDASCDLYAAAVVLYEMLTGDYPWRRDVLLAGTRARGDFRLPDAVLAGAPPDLARLLQDHLDRLGDPEAAARPDTTRALREARQLRDVAIAESRAA
jgi:serine/threonine-protein kinase